jgi:gliding motility-associated lipoprotein GldD
MAICHSEFFQMIYFRAGRVNTKTLIYFFVALMLLASCDEPLIPRKKGYLRIEIPAAGYTQFDPQGCPFKFEVSKIAVIEPDTNSLSEPCWWYINYPTLNGQLFLSYKPVKNNFNVFAEDSRALVYKHTQRANAINEEMVSNNYHASGILYNIGGNAASSIQFFMTDSSKHFLRGALYFNSIPNADSLAPVIDYIKKDIDHMLSTLQWKGY